jgi:hypothetical protein
MWALSKNSTVVFCTHRRSADTLASNRRPLFKDARTKHELIVYLGKSAALCFTCTNLCTALSLLKSHKTLLCLLKYHPTCFDPLGSSSEIPYYLLVELLDIKMYIKWCI